MKKLLIGLFILTHIAAFSQKFTISGYVKDGTTGEELIGATILVKELGSGIATNYYGYYSLSLPKGNYTVSYSYVSYKTIANTIEVNQDLRMDIELAPEAEQIEEVVVGAEALDKNVKSTEMSVQKLTMKEVKSIPAIFGEQDVMKTLILLPGVKTGSEGSGGIYVRGGGADQNLIILDESPVYNASHVGGLFSVFNPDAIKDMKLYKGGFPAEYGGRLSSVVDIKMKEGNTKKYGISGGIGLLSSKLAIEGPIVKDKGSFLIAARRSYLDLFFGLSKDTTIQDMRMFFYDLNIKANYKINENNRIFLSGYFGKDVFAYSDMFGMNWANTTGTLRWNHLFNDKLFSNTSLIYSNYLFNYDMSFAGTSIDLYSGIKDINLKQDFTYFYNENNNLKFGIQEIYHTFSPGDYTLSFKEFDENTVTFDIDSPDEYALESAIYLQNDHKLSKRLSVNYGLRLSDFALLGKYTAYRDYNRNGQPQDSTIYNSGDLVKNYIGLEPRISGTFVLDDVSSIKAAFGKTNQYINLIQTSSSTTPIDYWIPANEIIKPQASYQYVLGYFRNFKENMYETSIEVYYKTMNNQIDFKNGGDPYNYEHIENEIIFGKGQSYGIEMLIKKVYGKYSGWITYTLSKTERSFDEVYDGAAYPYRQDRNHDLAIVNMFQLTKKISISASWVYYTGEKVTMPSAKYNIDGAYDVPVYTSRNGYSYPDYHRLDLSLNFDFNGKLSKENNLNISIYNVYARKNAYTIYFREVEGGEDGEMEAVKVSLYTIIPSITWSFKF